MERNQKGKEDGTEGGDTPMFPPDQGAYLMERGRRVIPDEFFGV